ncbi:GNAT family N-acetyltransferase [Caldovatus aquaticus]|uniref:GNAT family N-acetyltransferase n=1 Tax=Caldovatus aquaticus TaxID=2865671 RepID=A0ABS7F4V2_9PROT|nr:GNAT family N-acetyltransferase [Caldovatus aquaticus]MBW8270548.1 GNAT family N-acetyltransferase [Caldovatus aquaticus]
MTGTGPAVTICIRRARPGDAAAIGAVHAETWRSTYAGVLPDAYLAALCPHRLGYGYERAILDRRDGHAVFVAVAAAAGGGEGTSAVVGFASGGRSRRSALAEGEIETLYLLDDFRERGVGRRLMRAMAAHLHAIGCRSAMLWVLRDNPTRWFYERLGGRLAAREVIRFAGCEVEQQAMVWDPIEVLLAATASAPER